jgi:glycerophosphoryl diester phosphodiesterase
MIRKNLKYRVTFTYLLLLFLSCSNNKNEAVRAETLSSQFNVVDVIQQRAESQILVCAHRGYHKYAPENSLEAIQKAIEANIDIVEVDVNTTKDGTLILMHDDKIDRTTNGSGYVNNFTYSELLVFNLKIKDSITDHKIPTLAEVLELAKGKVILNLDIKDVDISKFYILLSSHQMQHEVFSFIWDKQKISEMQGIDPTYAILPLVSSKEDIMHYAESLNLKLQHFDEQSFTNSNMKWAKNNEIVVFMNSLWQIDKDFFQNQFDGMNEMIELKPAIIQTDHPKILMNYLRHKNLHN